MRIQTLNFESMTRKSILGGIWAEKDRVVRFACKLAQWYLKDADSYSDISFLNLFVSSENWHTWFLMMLILVPLLVL